MTRTRFSILVAALLALGVAACGEKHETLSPKSAQPLTLMLDYFPNADHVGIYQALSAGEFARAGLDLRVQAPSDPSLPLKLVASGKVDVAISYEPELLLARDRGEPLVSIAALVQRPLTSIISLGAKGVRTPAQLRRKRVGDAGIPYQHAYLTTILHAAGVPSASVRETNLGFNLVPGLLSRRVDAVLGAYWNYEAIQLSRLRKRPNVLRVDQLGVPPYDELVLVVSRSTLATKADQLRRLVQAIARGYESTRRDPQAAVSALVRAAPGLDPKLQLASTHATLGAFFPADSSKPWGWQDATTWNAYGQWMLSNHLISNPAAVSDASTDELLAGQGP